MSGSPLALMVWLSPAFPVGAFAYSHGLEWAFEAGDLHDVASLRDWLADLVQHGALRNDLILLAEAWRGLGGADPFHGPHPEEAATAAASKEAPGGSGGISSICRDAVADGAAPQDEGCGKTTPDTLPALCELALALANSAERRLETVTQGNAFLATIRAAWPCDAVERLRALWPGDVAYPIAVGAAAAGRGLPLRETLDAFGLAFAANLVSAAVRLGIVGQTDGQRITAGLLPRLRQAAAFAEMAGLDDLGAGAFRSDIAALRHETQYSRLFRS